MWLNYFLLSLLWTHRISVSAQEENESENYAQLFHQNNTFQGNSSIEEENDSIFLPKCLTPTHYLVRLQPFLSGNFSVEGYVEITLEVREQSSKIVLHISDIITKNETVKVYPIDDENNTVPIESQEYDHAKNFYIVTLEEELPEGETYVLALEYEGLLSETLKGFYRSSYKDDEGNTRYLATTQFQPTDARKAFPCFDEPAWKAEFSIRIIREEGMKTISNMPLEQTIPLEDQEGWFMDVFNKSFPMSTYLVAFIVSDFDFLEASDTGEYKFRVYARPNAIESGKYAVELGPKVSRFYEDFFNVSFPLPKQDMAAVPDFNAGAMENWGLIIYRESSFLYNPEVAKAENKMSIASIISHELAHQWFGNLVTPSWWTDLWLNEGFASYMEYIGLRETEPSLRPLDQFIVLDLHKAFGLDCLESSHPISIPVNNPDEINSIFDSISYSKGASIIRMMSSYLTEESFRKALTKYLTELSYKNAEQDDLWEYLTIQSHEDGTLDSNLTVKIIMDTWTLQMGYPVVTVSRNSDGTVTVTQERFLLTKNGASTDTHDYKWWIPLTFTTQSEKDFETLTPKSWMSPDEASKIVPVMSTIDEWVIFNIGENGYYRVNYDDRNWASIALQLALDPTVFPDANRAQLLDDSLNLARAGHLSYKITLNLLTYLSKEKEFVPIKAALDNLDYIKNMLSFSGGYGHFKTYLTSLIVPLYEEVNFSDSLSDPHFQQRKRELITQWACDLGHQFCIEAAVELFNNWMKNPNDSTIISPNLKSVVYCTAIREGGAKEWKFAWDRYIDTHVGTEQKELLEALACSEDAWILGEFLNRSVTPNQGIKKQMLRYIIPAVAKSNMGKMVAWQFIRDRWSDILRYLGSVNFVLDEIVGSVTKYLNTEVHNDEMKQFREKYEGKFASAARAVKQASENLENNLQWMNNYYDVIVQWLKKNEYESDI